MEAKKAAFALLLPLVVAVLCFFTGQTSARHSALDIQGGLEAAEPSCSKCECGFIDFPQVICFCVDKGPSCHQGCKRCSCLIGGCKCLDFVDRDQCKTIDLRLALGSKASVEEAMLAAAAAAAGVLG